MRLGAAVLIAVVAMAQPGGRVIQHPQGAYSLNVPAGWTASFEGEVARVTRGAAYTNILTVQGGDPASAVAGFSGQIQNQWRNVRVTGRGPANVAGGEGMVQISEGINPKGVAAVWRVAAGTVGESTFVFLSSAPRAEYAALKAAFEQIEAGLQTGGTASPTETAGPTGSEKPLFGAHLRDLEMEDLGQNGITTLQGSLIVDVMPGSPAAQAGVEAGDIIVVAGDQAIRKSQDFLQVMETQHPGDTLRMMVNRRGRPLEMNVRLGRRSEQGETPQPVEVDIDKPGDLAPDQPAAPAGPTLPSPRLKPARINGFGISLPDNWAVTPSPNSKFHAAGAPDGVRVEPDGNFAFMLGLLTAYEPAAGRVLKPGTDYVLQHLQVENPSLKVLARQAITLAGQPAESLLLSGLSREGAAEQSWMVTTVRPQGLLFVALVAPAAEFQQLRVQFGRIVESIRF